VTATLAIPLAAPVEAWWLWITVVALAIVMGLLIGWLRRCFLRPMRHEPTRMVDSWTEAGRRFHADPAGEDDAPAGGNGEDA